MYVNFLCTRTITVPVLLALYLPVLNYIRTGTVRLFHPVKLQKGFPDLVRLTSETYSASQFCVHPVKFSNPYCF